MQQSHTKHLVVKLGAEGFIAYQTEEDNFVNRQHFPAICPNPVDVAGAGDSLLACMAVKSLCWQFSNALCSLGSMYGELGSPDSWKSAGWSSASSAIAQGTCPKVLIPN